MRGICCHVLQQLLDMQEVSTLARINGLPFPSQFETPQAKMWLCKWQTLQGMMQMYVHI